MILCWDFRNLNTALPYYGILNKCSLWTHSPPFSAAESTQFHCRKSKDPMPVLTTLRTHYMSFQWLYSLLINIERLSYEWNTHECWTVCRYDLVRNSLWLVRPPSSLLSLPKPCYCLALTGLHIEIANARIFYSWLIAPLLLLRLNRAEPFPGQLDLIEAYLHANHYRNRWMLPSVNRTTQ